MPGMEYLKKMKGCASRPPRASLSDAFWSWAGAFLGIAAVGWLQHGLLPLSDRMMLIGSFGATAILVYGAIGSPLAQPRNVIGGHLLSAVVGVACMQALGGTPWLAAAAAVSLAMLVMQLTNTLHPPGGATALIAVIGSAKVHALGFLYVLIPVGLGALVMLLVAVLVNNIPANRRYPLFWW